MNEYDNWHSAHSGDDDVSAPWHRFAIEQMSREVVADKTILEIGCGRGGFSNHLANYPIRPRKVIAADYSQAALDIASQLYGQKSQIVEWKREDIMNLSFADETFDTIISCETIEHVPNPKQAIKELFRVLKSGGTLVLTCPNYFNPFGVWCLYRWVIGKPFTEGGQPYVNYILFPRVMYWLLSRGLKIQIFKASEIIVPMRVPKNLWVKGLPSLLRPFGYRTFYRLTKPKN